MLCFDVSLSREALLLVPDSQREAMLALGATRWEGDEAGGDPLCAWRHLRRDSLSLGRALGEKCGGDDHWRRPQFPKTLFDQATRSPA